MSIYVKVVDGIAVNRIVAEDVLPPEWFEEGEIWVQNDEAQIGWSYDGTSFAAPDPGPEPEPGPALVPYGDFRARWAPSELEAMFQAKNTDWRVEDYVTLASAQGHVNLSSPTAAAAKALFVALGVLTTERADAIFAAG